MPLSDFNPQCNTSRLRAIIILASIATISRYEVVSPNCHGLVGRDPYTVVQHRNAVNLVPLSRVADCYGPRWNRSSRIADCRGEPDEISGMSQIGLYCEHDSRCN